MRVRLQTAVEGPWMEVPQRWEGAAPKLAALRAFDRATPVSYRVDAELENGVSVELWGYFQVRGDPRSNPLPLALSPDLIQSNVANAAPMVIDSLPDDEVDLLERIDPESCWKAGEWSKDGSKLLSPKRYGARQVWSTACLITSAVGTLETVYQYQFSTRWAMPLITRRPRPRRFAPSPRLRPRLDARRPPSRSPGPVSRSAPRRARASCRRRQRSTR